MKNKAIVLTILVAAVVAGWFALRPPKATQLQPNLTEVRFGMLPYGDHTQAIIGIQKGWFEEVGLKLRHEVIKIENVVPFLKNQTLDVCSSPAGLLYPAYESAPGLGVFVFADIFQGYGIVAQPGLNCKSYEEFVKEGLSSEDAFKAAVAQMKGKVFAYPSETAIKPFIDIVLEKGGITREELTSLVQDDALTVNSMRQGRAQFQVGGAPSRIIMQREGFKPIITSLDVAKTAKPSALSRELGSVFPDGWATTKKYFDERHEVILRLASVCMRINDFIVNNPKEALAIHMPFLTTVTGESFSEKDGMIIYSSLDPFYTFEQQKSWFHDPNDPFFYKHINGAGLQSFIEKGVFKAKTPDIEEFIFADDIYREMEALKEQADKLFAEIKDKNLAGDENRKTQLEQAKHHYSIYNFYDAQRIVKAIVEGN